MRRLLIAVALVGLTSAAYAADFEPQVVTESPAYAPTPFIPAPPTFMRWSGFYIGGQAGYGSAHMDFSGATESLIAFQLRELALENEQHPSQWPVLGTRDTGGASGGGFVGYNSQWDDVILSVELAYNKTNFSAQAPSSPIGRVVSAGGNTYDVTVGGDASMRINDYGTARVRAGYIMKTFMPWAAVGVAAGRADYARTATVFGAQNPPTGYPSVPCDPLQGCVEFSYSSSESKSSAWLYGWTVGGGVDMMILPHVLLRAEYEYTSFASLAGIKPAMNTVRVGAGFKF